MNNNINRELKDKVEGVSFDFMESDWEQMQDLLAANQRPAWVVWARRSPLLLLLVGAAGFLTWAAWPDGNNMAPIAQLTEGERNELNNEVNSTVYDQYKAITSDENSTSDVNSPQTSGSAVNHGDGTSTDVPASHITDNSNAAYTATGTHGVDGNQHDQGGGGRSAGTANDNGSGRAIGGNGNSTGGGITANDGHGQSHSGGIASNDGHGQGQGGGRRNALANPNEGIASVMAGNSPLDREMAAVQATEMSMIGFSDLPFTVNATAVENAIKLDADDYVRDDNLTGHPTLVTTTYFNFWDNPGYTGFEQKQNVHFNYGMMEPNDKFTNTNLLVGYDAGVGPTRKFGIGAYYFQRATTTRTEKTASLSLSYQFTFGDQHSLRLGTSFNRITHELDWEALNFGDAIHEENGFVGNTYEVQQEEKVSGLGLTTGLFYHNRKLYAAFSAENINQPDMSVLGSSSRISRRFRLNAGYRIIAKEKFHFVPSIQMSHSDDRLITTPSLALEFDQKIMVGVSYRNLTVWQINAGVNLTENFRLTFATGIPNDALAGVNKFATFSGGLRYQFGKVAGPK